MPLNYKFHNETVCFIWNAKKEHFGIALIGGHFVGCPYKTALFTKILTKSTILLVCKDWKGLSFLTDCKLKYDLCCIFTIVALCNIILKPSNHWIRPIVSASHDLELIENFGYQCIFIQFLFSRIYSFQISSARLWHCCGSWHVTSNVAIYI